MTVDQREEEVGLIEHYVLKDESGIQFGLDGVYCGQDRGGDDYYVKTPEDELVTHTDESRVFTLTDVDEQEAVGRWLIARCDLELAGRLIEALHLDFEMAL